MTYGRELFAKCSCALDGAVVSHLAELVRGDFLGRPLLPRQSMSNPVTICAVIGR